MFSFEIKRESHFLQVVYIVYFSSSCVSRGHYQMYIGFKWCKLLFYALGNDKQCEVCIFGPPHSCFDD